MKRIIYTLAIISVGLFAQDIDSNQTQQTLSPVTELAVDTNATQEVGVEQNATAKEAEANTEQDSMAEATEQNATVEATEVSLEQNGTDENGTSLVEQSETVVPKTQFEKSFPNHIAYKFYSKGVEALYRGDYKAAYSNAMKARAIYDIKEGQLGVIPLPYLPGFVKETAYSPKRFYYKIVKFQPYELRKLIIKAKLISPPIASVVIKKRSTSTDVIVRNFGDLPLDGFKLFINDKEVVGYDKINPNEEKIYSYDSADKIYRLSFTEEYGFAPQSMTIAEEE